MQLEIFLHPEMPVRLPFSYYPQLSAAVYSAMDSANPAFAGELHEGQDHKNRIKLFAFSPLYSRFCAVHGGGKGSHREPSADAYLLFKGKTQFRLCSPWPELMNAVGEGLLKAGLLRIGSQVFRIQDANLLPPPAFCEKMTWRPFGNGSVVTSWSPRNKGIKQFVFPDQTPADAPDCATLLKQNLIHKWRRLNEIRPDLASAWAGAGAACPTEKEKINVEIPPLRADKPYRTKLHQIISAPVRSWVAPVTVQAPVYLQRLIWSCGLGEMNSMGFGVVEKQP